MRRVARISGNFAGTGTDSECRQYQYNNNEYTAESLAFLLCLLLFLLLSLLWHRMVTNACEDRKKAESLKAESRKLL